jgi:hypothetical protein
MQLGIKKPSQHEGKKVLIAMVAFGQEGEEEGASKRRDYVITVTSSDKCITRWRYTGLRYR